MENSNIPVQYQLNVESITKHLFSVSVSIDTSHHRELNVRLPSWIPGSYMVRDFAKNIVSLTVENGTGDHLPLVKIDKQSWHISGCDQKTLIRYHVYAFDLSIRSAFLDNEFGFANGTSVFLQIDEFKDTPAAVVLSPVVEKPQWQVYTAMEKLKTAGSGYGYYISHDYQDLIEHPLLFGDADKIGFTTGGIEFSMVFVGGHNADLARIKTDLTKICEHHLKMFEKNLPIQRYMFMTILTESDFGGLEHTHSTALMYSRGDLPTICEKETLSDGYRTFLSLCSHELFHTWHVKRIKPKVLLNPDLSKEIHTEQLWIYEGFTSYYDDFSLLRAGLIDQKSYLELLGQTLTRLQRTDGRFNQTVTSASFDTWTKFYKQDENANNAIVSYYVKGAAVALCLDLMIRKKSRDTYSLDSVMRFLWKHYGIGLRGTDDNVIQVILKEGFGLNMDDFLASALYTTDELPIANLLADYGIELKIRARDNQQDKGGKPGKEPITIADLGALYSISAKGLVIKQTINGRAAEQAGLQKGDCCIALNKMDIRDKSLETELNKYPLGSKLSLTFFRRGILLQTRLTVMPAVQDTIYLDITNEAQASRWLTKPN